MFVISQGATQQTQVVECQDQDYHAAKRNAANPPVTRKKNHIINPIPKKEFNIYMSCQSALEWNNEALLNYSYQITH